MRAIVEVFGCRWGLGFGVLGLGIGLVFKAHRLVYHSTLGWRVIKKRRRIGGTLLRS